MAWHRDQKRQNSTQLPRWRHARLGPDLDQIRALATHPSACLLILSARCCWRGGRRPLGRWVRACRSGWPVAPLLEGIEVPRDDVPTFVVFLVKGRRSSAGGASPFPVAFLFGRFRDHRGDASFRRVRPDRTGMNRLVPAHAVRASPRPARTGPLTFKCFVRCGNFGASPRWPEATSKVRGRPLPSTRAWILVRPMAWSGVQ